MSAASAAVDITRDYFITNPAIQLDSYNVDDVELSRGPNSTLFGIGSPSGILNESIEKAVLNKDSNEISARYGSFGDFRSTLNLNRALIPDKLAIAVAGLYANAHPTGQEPDYDIQRREFAAITLKPFADTTIRANVEYYDNPNRRAEQHHAGRRNHPLARRTAARNGIRSRTPPRSTASPRRPSPTASAAAGLVSGLGNARVGFRNSTSSTASPSSGSRRSSAPISPLAGHADQRGRAPSTATGTNAATNTLGSDRLRAQAYTGRQLRQVRLDPRPGGPGHLSALP